MRLRATLLTLGLVLMGVVGVAAPAQASAPGDIRPPFTFGEQWYICQGYNNAAVTHTGTSAYGLDLTGSPNCGNGASGRTVIAPISGSVYYYQAAYGNLCVNIAGGRSYTLTHINSSVTSGTVFAGQNVGTVAAAVLSGPPNNGNVAHIHFQLWDTANCYSSSGIPFDSAHGARICGAPDLTATGPSGGNGTWSGTTFTGDSCGSSSPGPYPGVGSGATFKGGATLSAGEELHSNEYLMSSNGQTVLMMQTDGNLVLYRASAAALWYSGTGNHSGAYATVQTDGNIVVYSASNVPLWWTGTTSVTTLTVQTDGNLVGYPATGPAEWQAGTGGEQPLTHLGSNHLSAGDQIHPNQYIRSADGRYFLMAQTDGNIVLYGPGYHVLWTTGTGGHPGGAYIVVQTDGNIVVYSATSTALWWTGTTNTAILWLQNDGNLVGRNSADAPTWSSGTGGQI
jgi:hypothetical protein